MAKSEVERISVSDAMREAGVFSQQVYAAIGSGKLEAVREGGRWKISRPSFDVWKARLKARRELAAEDHNAQTPRRFY